MPLEKIMVAPRTADLADYFTVNDLDRAVDQAAQAVRAVVAEFAAVTAIATDGRPAVELAVEFFVPPATVEFFAAQLDEVLMALSVGYATARHRGAVLPPSVRPVAMGAFHQWRVAWRRNESTILDGRWSKARDLIDGVLRQSMIGWREHLAV